MSQIILKPPWYDFSPYILCNIIVGYDNATQYIISIAVLWFDLDLYSSQRFKAMSFQFHLSFCPQV